MKHTKPKRIKQNTNSSGIKAFSDLLHHSKIYLVAIAVLMIVFTILRLVELGSTNLWRDEAFTVLQAIKPIGETIKISLNDTNPPLHAILLNIWITVFGSTEFSVRLPSVLFSLIAFLYTFKLSQKLLTKNEQLIALVLLTVNTVSIFYSQEARAYSMLMAFITAGAYYTIDLCEEMKLSKALKFIFANTLAIYTHNLALFFLVIEGIYILYTVLQQVDLKKIISSKNKTLLMPWLYTFATLGFLIMPWLFQFYKQSKQIEDSFWLNFDPANAIHGTIVDMVSGYRLFSWRPIDPGIASLITLSTLLILIGTGYEIMVKRSAKASYFFWGTLILFYILSFKRAFLYVRYMSFLIPIMIILMTQGISYFRDNFPKLRLVSLTVFALITTLSLYTYYLYINTDDRREHFSEMTEYVATNSTRHDLVIHATSLTYFPYEYYEQRICAPINNEASLLDDNPCHYKIDSYSDGRADPLKSYIYDPEDLTPYYVGRAQIREEDFIRNPNDLSKYSRIWVVDQAWEPSDRTYLEDQQYHMVSEQRYLGNLILQLWEK